MCLTATKILKAQRFGISSLMLVSDRCQNPEGATIRDLTFDVCVWPLPKSGRRNDSGPQVWCLCLTGAKIPKAQRFGIWSLKKAEACCMFPDALLVELNRSKDDLNQ